MTKPPNHGGIIWRIEESQRITAREAWARWTAATTPEDRDEARAVFVLACERAR